MGENVAQGMTRGGAHYTVSPHLSTALTVPQVVN
jgi:hypothetical protein